jgi:hypothetical protein
MIFTLDVRRARKGDCLLLHFGTKAKPGLIMIDGGHKSVYAPQLKPRLQQIREARGLGANVALPVDVLLVSHVDDDHIQGILDFTREEKARVATKKPRLLNVFSLWHNSFDEIIGGQPEELTSKVKGAFKTEASTGMVELSDSKAAEIEDIFLDASAGDNEDDPEVVGSTLKVLASISQGFQLRTDADGLGYGRNVEFGGKLIVAKAGAKPKTIAGSLKVTVVGPMHDELVALHKKHQQWLKKLEAEGKTPEDALAAYVDKSVPNLSSIVALVEADGKKMLLTGDARGDKILKGLQLVGLLDDKDKNSTIEVDIVKVPHHGSARNLDNDFFKRIIARHYVFSGNGEHGNPERAALEMLLKARGAGGYDIHLTYELEKIDEEREKDWNKERNKEKARKEKKGKGEVREKWSPADHGLIAFFDANPALKLQIVPEGKAHVIDLSDKLADSWSALGN